MKCIAALGLLITCAVAESATPSELSVAQVLAKEIYKQLIEINTTHSLGDTSVAARAMADRLLAAGVPKEDVHVLENAPRKGNLVARLRARKPSGQKPILLMAHLDVVEARREDWSVDPFKFIEKDGYYYGRGTLDDKAMAAIFVSNLVRYIQEGYRPKRDIIVALTADEEGGPNNGMSWLLEKHRDLIDAAFALNEGGVGELRDGKKILNGVQAAEKVYQSFTMTVANRGGHSSLPRKDNAIYRLSAAMTRLSQFDFPVMLNEVSLNYFAKQSRLASGQEALDLKAVASANPDPQVVVRLSENAVYNGTLRTTCVATLLTAGHAENALPQTATATVNCRMLPNHDPQDVLTTLKKVIADDGVVVNPVAAAKPSPPSPLAKGVMVPIERITARMWSGVPVVPLMSTAATDAVPLRANGIPVYGVSGLFIDMDDVRIHGRDERLHASSYFDGLEFMYQLVKELTH